MSNHYHMVLHINTEEAKQLSTLEVIEHWHQLFKGNVLTQRYSRGETLIKAERETLTIITDTWRERLANISWFMRLINEGIARQANKEDGCTGCFWEGRFKSQALLDEQALFVCMAYVDLNPLRAKMAKTPERSHRTSIKKHIAKAQTTRQINHPQQQEKSLMRFAGNPRQVMPEGLPCRLSNYLELVDWTGRIVRDDKRGAIDNSIPPLLSRLNISAENWLTLSTQFEGRFGRVIGTLRHLKQACAALDYRRTPGKANCKLLFEGN